MHAARTHRRARAAPRNAFLRVLRNVVTRRKIDVETRGKDASLVLRVAHLPTFIAYSLVIASIYVYTAVRSL